MVERVSTLIWAVSDDKGILYIIILLALMNTVLESPGIPSWLWNLWHLMPTCTVFWNFQVVLQNSKWANDQWSSNSSTTLLVPSTACFFLLLYTNNHLSPLESGWGHAAQSLQLTRWCLFDTPLLQQWLCQPRIKMEGQQIWQSSLIHLKSL